MRAGSVARLSVAMICAAGCAIGLFSTGAAATVSTLSSNFNGTSIAAGRTIWFSSVFKASGVGSGPVTFYIRSATVSFTSGSTTYDVLIPNSDITIDSSLSTAQASFASNQWTILAQTNLAGNDFMAGAGFTVPASGISGGVNPVTWTADIYTDAAGAAAGVSLTWQWAAAVYSSFGSDLSTIGAKPVDDNSASSFLNSDHAGTPESYTSFVLGGARGGGGSNFTGSYSGTSAAVHPTLAPFELPAPAALPLAGVGVMFAARRSRRPYQAFRPLSS